MNSNGWSVIADEYRQQLERLREILGARVYKKTLERAVTELIEENAMLYRWNHELRTMMPLADAPPAAPIQLDDSWTSRT